MNLFDKVNENVFSVLASPNKRIYAEALDVLYDTFIEEGLQISEDSFYTRLRGRMEDVLSSDKFTLEEDMLDDERINVSGRARFIMRKLFARGWFEKERGDDFNEYITLPSYSIKLLELFHILSDNAPNHGDTYVFGTYATLKQADSDQDVHIKVLALYSAHDSTDRLITLLKTVYHNIARYFNEQVDMSDLKSILAAHYDDFIQQIVDTYIRPLKIKDSVPKYRVSIENILDGWLDNSELIISMAQDAFENQRGNSAEACRSDIVSKILSIKRAYEDIQNDYLEKIDRQVRKYTRATTQKIEILTNNDQTVRGNIIYLLKKISSAKKEESIIDLTAPIFEIYQQGYISEKSLWHRKRGKKREITSPVIIEENSVSEEDIKELDNILNNKYSKKNVREYIQGLLSTKETISSDEIKIQDDTDYIMTALATVNADDGNVFYEVEYDEGSTVTGNYSIPMMRFRKRRD